MMRFWNRYRERRLAPVFVKDAMGDAELASLRRSNDALAQRNSLLELENERLRKCLTAEEERVLRIAAEYSNRFIDFNAFLSGEVAQVRPMQKCEDCDCGGPY